MAMNRSQLLVAISARRIASSGIDWPKEIVAVLTYSEPQAGHSGMVSLRRKLCKIGARSMRVSQSRHLAKVALPCNSITCESSTPETWCRPSIFWVITVVALPRPIRAETAM